MNDLNTVYKAFQNIKNNYSKDSIEYNYYNIIMKYLLLEHKYSKEVILAGKPILHYFKYYLPQYNKNYFEWLYNSYNPVRFAVETFDSIEEIKKELINGSN